jgi:hypothetical protein
MKLLNLTFLTFLTFCCLACTKIAQKKDAAAVEKDPTPATDGDQPIDYEPYQEGPTLQGYDGNSSETVSCVQQSAGDCSNYIVDAAFLEQEKKRCTLAGGEVQLCNCAEFLCSKAYVAGKDDLTIDDTSEMPVGYRPNGTGAKCDPVGKPDTCEASATLDLYHKDCTDAGGKVTDCSCSSFICSKPFNTVIYTSDDYDQNPVMTFEVSLPKDYFLASTEIQAILSKEGITYGSLFSSGTTETYVRKPTEPLIIKTKQFQLNERYILMIIGRRAAPYCDTVDTLVSSVLTQPSNTIKDLVFLPRVDSYSKTYVEGKGCIEPTFLPD